MSKSAVPQTQVIDVTLLQNGDYYYPVFQDTGERHIEDGLYLVVKAPSIDHKTGGIRVKVHSGWLTYQNGAQVAREVATA
jgi:hypothetical protein